MRLKKTEEKLEHERMFLFSNCHKHLSTKQGFFGNLTSSSVYSIAENHIEGTIASPTAKFPFQVPYIFACALTKKGVTNLFSLIENYRLAQNDWNNKFPLEHFRRSHSVKRPQSILGNLLTVLRGSLSSQIWVYSRLEDSRICRFNPSFPVGALETILSVAQSFSWQMWAKLGLVER